MEIKGTAVKTTPDFIKTNYANRYDEWLNSLPEKSKKIMLEPIYATSWFPLIDSVIYPTMKTGDMFFKSHEEAAIQLGRYSAEIALNGIYKIFLKISSPGFVLSRAASVFSTYYNPSDIKVIENKEKTAVIQFAKFTKGEELIMYRIAGWIQKTLEITVSSEARVEVNHFYNGTELVSKISSFWK